MQGTSTLHGLFVSVIRLSPMALNDNVSDRLKDAFSCDPHLQFREHGVW